MGNFQSIFPEMIIMLWQIEQEDFLCGEEQTQDLEFKNHLSAFKDEMTKTMCELSSHLYDIDDQIAFFGDNYNDQPPTQTILEMRKMWKNLNQLGILPEKESSSRAKRDEDRYTFFINISTFVTDVKNAYNFLEAQKEKENQKVAYQKHVDSPLRYDAPGKAIRQKSVGNLVFNLDDVSV